MQRYRIFFKESFLRIQSDNITSDEPVLPRCCLFDKRKNIYVPFNAAFSLGGGYMKVA